MKFTDLEISEKLSNINVKLVYYKSNESPEASYSVNHGYKILYTELADLIDAVGHENFTLIHKEIIRYLYRELYDYTSYRRNDIERALNIV